MCAYSIALTGYEGEVFKKQKFLDSGESYRRKDNIINDDKLISFTAY